VDVHPERSAQRIFFAGRRTAGVRIVAGCPFFTTKEASGDVDYLILNKPPINQWSSFLLREYLRVEGKKIKKGG